MRTDKFPLISCVMPTYGRPQYVHESVEMFLGQGYPAKELVILNDCAGQVFHSELPSVRVINTARRFASLGEKRNECIRQAQGDFLAIWDDDDIYLPWRLSFSMSELRRWDTEFYRPAEFLAYWGEEFLHDNQAVPGWLNHATVLFRKDLWQRVGGYPARDVGEDAEFFARIHRELGQEFIKYPLSRADRFMVLRGASQYRHLSHGGGKQKLDTEPGEYHILPRPIADAQLRELVRQAIAARGIQAETGTPNDAANLNNNEPPRLSICISLKNRSRIRHDSMELQLFPNCVRSLRAAAESAGPIELIVADFHSDDWPLDLWLFDQSTDSFRIQCIQVEGEFSRGRGLNIAANHASCDQLFLCDADILVSADALRRGLQVLSDEKASFPICRYTQEDGKLDIWQELGYGLAFLHRKHLMAAHGVPEFERWGGEDNLLRDRIVRWVDEVRQRDDGLKHQWHPDSYRHVNFAEPAVVGLQRARRPSCESRKLLERLVGEHPCWAGPTTEIRLYTDGRMERPGVDAGSFEFEPCGKLVLHWDNWPAEILLWSDSESRYKDPTKAFSLRPTEVSGEPRSWAIENALDDVRAEFSELARHLRTIAPFQYLASPGNWGDAIIRSGTLKLFKRLELQYVEISKPSDAKGELPAVLGGSGGFCRFWQWSPHAAQELAERCCELLVLPSSYEAASLEWSRGLANVTLYAREHLSLEAANGNTSRYCPDMAFWNDADAYSVPTLDTLHAFRKDNESLDRYCRYSDNRDLSTEHDHSGSPSAFFEQVARYRMVHTDRAHVAIAGAMLGGRKVAFYPNAYHKNAALYKSCLQRFDVSWNPLPTSNQMPS